MPRRTSIPSYRLHKQSGQAVVTLTDVHSGRRKDILLGEHDSPASRAEYGRVIASWEARGRRLEDLATPSDLSVAELVVRFLKHAKNYYRDPETGKVTTEYHEFFRATGPLTDAFPHLDAASFGPSQLKVVRERMLALDWARNTINQRVRRLRHIWKWGVEEGVVPANAWHSLQVVRGLQAGRSKARETAPRRPVDDDVVDATLPFLPRHARGLVEFIRLTGCRPAEACRLRMADVDATGDAWIYSPPRHKCSWRGHDRQIGIGPQGQRVLAAFTDGLPPDEFVFSPFRQREERFAVMRAARKTRVQPSQASRRKPKPQRLPGPRFEPGSLHQAVAKACRKAGVSAWTPYQLRHAAGAKARREYGLDAAQALLGHRTLSMTEHYSKQTVDDLIRVASRVA